MLVIILNLQKSLLVPSFLMRASGRLKNTLENFNISKLLSPGGDYAPVDIARPQPLSSAA